MLKFLILATVAAVVSSSHDRGLLIPNRVWKQFDQVVKDIHTIQDNLVQSIEEVKNQQKRSFSIIMTTLLRYLQTNTQPHSMKGINEPIDVYAAETVRSIAREQLLLELPIYVVKKSCRPTTDEWTCYENICLEILDLKDKCFGITKHINLALDAVNLHNNPEYRNLLKSILEFSQHANDKDSYEFVIDVITDDKYTNIRAMLQDYYRSYARKDYECIKAHYKNI